MDELVLESVEYRQTEPPTPRPVRYVPGIPARIVVLSAGRGRLVIADVQGSKTPVDIAMLAPDDPVREADWVMLHMGMAVEASEVDALEARAVLATLGPGERLELSKGFALPAAESPLW